MVVIKFFFKKFLEILNFNNFIGRKLQSRFESFFEINYNLKINSIQLEVGFHVTSNDTVIFCINFYT